MTIGFSWVGLLYLVLLFLPNIVWLKFKPKGYAPSSEDRVLMVMERLGEVMIVILLPIYREFTPREMSSRIVWFIVSAVCMALYEFWWIRYFTSARELRDFYSGLFGIPAAGAWLPAAALLTIGIYGNNIYLILSAIMFGVGHVGIHLGHLRDLNSKESKDGK